ncbi:MAG TPA: helix-turn-helix domain-containing protein [Thermoanaerobaculia bacterium]|nr:helix-turn-helix domain-containing protein [Thermoanaerobaculia bacterium]
MGRPARVTREEVLRQARRTFAERGFHGTTLAAIAARLNISPAALLRHAPTKHALFEMSMASEMPGEGLPTDFLAAVPASEDPARVLRRLAEGFVPFIEQKMGENIARFLRASSEEEARMIRLPFDPRRKSSPPARAVKALETYFRRAGAARRVKLSDPRAAALAFLGSLQSYVFFHRVLRIEPLIPLDRYLDTVIGVWKRGALRPDRRGR